MIVLVGFMGAGKTTIGRALAERLGLPFVDVDDVISDRAGRSIPVIFESDGEPAFRALERDATIGILRGDEAVVALGGGALGDPDTRAALDGAEVVYLRADLDVHLRRTGTDEGRPMLAARSPEELLAERVPLYEAAATVVVDTGGRDPGEVVAELEDLLKGRGSWRRVRVELGQRSYTVHVGTGLASRLAELLPRGYLPEKAVLITHPALMAAARPVAESLRNAGIEVHPIEVGEGESSKRWDAAGEILEEMAAAALHRQDMVVSFGGGVVTDLAGFVASTYARGIPVVHVATSLLAQVDAAVGGKTGVNLTSGKNLAGTFHQPAAVICDVALLRTLPDEEFTSGMAEVVKYGLIADPTILQLLSDRVLRDEGSLEELVARSVSVKAEIVAADETEQGSRAYLNYGHTFAHAFELARGYGDIRHGEAVALGMMAAAYAANELGRIDDGLVDVHRRTLEAVGLPVAARFDYDELEPAWLRDKKYDRGVRFVLLAGRARPEAGVLVERAVVERALERLAV